MELIKGIFNRVKRQFPQLVSTYVHHAKGGRIKIDFDRILNSSDIECIKSIVKMFEELDYVLGNTISLDYVSTQKLTKYDLQFPVGRKKFFSGGVESIKDGEFYSSRNELIKLEGEKIVNIEFVESWSDLEAWKVTEVKNDLAYYQRLIDSDPQFLDSFDTRKEGDRQYWFIIKPSNEFNIKPWSMNKLVLVAKLGEENPDAVSRISFRVTDRGSYATDTTFVLPKHRGKGFSTIMDKYIIEKTGLKYSTNLELTKPGFLKMRANKKILPWESFINNFLNW